MIYCLETHKITVFESLNTLYFECARFYVPSNISYCLDILHIYSTDRGNVARINNTPICTLYCLSTNIITSEQNWQEVLPVHRTQITAYYLHLHYWTNTNNTAQPCYIMLFKHDMIVYWMNIIELSHDNNLYLYGLVNMDLIVLLVFVGVRLIAVPIYVCGINSVFAFVEFAEFLRSICMSGRRKY